VCVCVCVCNSNIFKDQNNSGYIFKRLKVVCTLDFIYLKKKIASGNREALWFELGNTAISVTVVDCIICMYVCMRVFTSV